MGMDVQKMREFSWNKRRKDPVLLTDTPSDREILETATIRRVEQVQNAISRVLLEIMDSQEELQKALSRFEV